MKKLLKRIGICLVLAASVWCGSLLADRQRLNDELIRFHVVANSDSEEDQSIKLQVRDAVLVRAEELLREADDRAEAEKNLQAALPELRQIAQDTVSAEGYDYGVTAELADTAFPTREYDGFTLPAGDYLALRLVIGSGEGHNWWCVVFPSLCLPAATQEEALLTLPEGERQVVEGGQDVQVKLKAVELWESLREWLRG